MIIFYEDEQDTIQDEMDIFTDKGYRTECFDNAVSLLKFYKENITDIKAIIIDIMVFGPGNEFNNENNSGFKSGISLLDSLFTIENATKESISPLKFIYTNRNKFDIISNLEKDKRVKKVFQKNSQFYDEFVKEVLQIIEQ